MLQLCVGVIAISCRVHSFDSVASHFWGGGEQLDMGSCATLIDQSKASRGAH